MTNLYPLLSNNYIISLLVILFTSIVCSKIYPAIIHLGYKKNLMDEPGNRSMHERKTPTLGGIGVFITFSIGIILSSIIIDLDKAELSNLIAILGSMIILLFTGIKDDLLDMSATTKMMIQVVAALLVVYVTDIRITNLNGFLGLNEIPELISLFISVFIFVFLINSFNLIDGIDGLAGSIGVQCNLVFGIFFLLNENYLHSLISFVMVGALLGFLKYNLSKTKKLFLGDSGSLFIGFLLAYQSIFFLVTPYSILGLEYLSFFNRPLILSTILIFPSLDTIRIFSIRIYQGRSPFSADSNHIHHKLLRFGLNHKQATFSIIFSNSVLIIFCLATASLNPIQQISFLFLFVLIMFIELFIFLPYLINNSSNSKELSIEEEIILSFKELPKASSPLVLVNKENKLFEKKSSLKSNKKNSKTLTSSKKDKKPSNKNKFRKASSY